MGELDAHWGIFFAAKMSEPSDRNAPEEPANWILQHPTVSSLAPNVAFKCLVLNRVLIFLCQYQLMKAMETDDSQQRHAAFLVYMDLSEGEGLSSFALRWSNH